VKWSIFEERRRAPAHHWARAENARYCAFVLWSFPKRHAAKAKAKAKIAYGGTPAVALDEAYKRKAALALELIIKALPSASRFKAKRAVKRRFPTFTTFRSSGRSPTGIAS
jgi:hypothetical protein